MFGPFLMAFGLIFDQFFIDVFHCISVTLLLNYMHSWRGGGDAALLRVGYLNQIDNSNNMIIMRANMS